MPKARNQFKRIGEDYQAELAKEMAAAEACRARLNQEAMEKSSAAAAQAANEKAASAARAKMALAKSESQSEFSEEFAQAQMEHWIAKQKEKNKALGISQKSKYGRNKAAIGGYFDELLSLYNAQNPGAPFPKAEDLIAFGNKINHPIPMARRKHFGSHYCHWQGSHNSFLPLHWQMAQKK